MWTRRLSTSMKIDQGDFVEAFLLALDNDKIVKKLQGGLFTQLQTEIGQLKDIIQHKDSKIENLEELTEVKNATDALEQYSRRNSLRISGLVELQNENPTQVALSFCNERLCVQPAITLSDIDRVHRVGRRDGDPARARMLLVKFSTYRARQRVFAARVALKPAHRQRPPDDPWHTGQRQDADSQDAEPNSTMSPASQPTNHEPMTTQTRNDDQVIAYSRKAFQGRDNIWVN